MLGRLLSRLLLVPLGAAIAVMVAAAVVFVAHWQAFVVIIDADPPAQQDYAFAFLFAAPLLALLLSIWGVYTLVPAAAGVLISEAFAIRSWIFHAGNGGLSAWIGWTLTHDIRDEYRLLTDPEIVVAAGLAAGFAYWLIAGRSAGFFKPIGSAATPDRPAS